MNTTFQRQQYGGFRLNDSLCTNLAWQGVVRIADKAKIIKPLPDDRELVFWTFKDEFGARFSCFQEKVANEIVIGEKYVLKGEIKIGKGGTFLNIKTSEVFNGRDFTEK